MPPVVSKPVGVNVVELLILGWEKKLPHLGVLARRRRQVAVAQPFVCDIRYGVTQVSIDPFSVWKSRGPEKQTARRVGMGPMRPPWKAITGIVAVLVVLVFALLLALRYVPLWWDHGLLHALKGSPKDRAVVIDNARGRIFQIVLGAGAAGTLIYTARSHSLTKRGQVTERFTKAVGLLASEKTEERLGGVYSLEQIMRDSLDDHATIVEVLAAFVRGHAPRERWDAYDMDEQDFEPSNDELPPQLFPGKGLKPRPEVQAAMTVLARRPKRNEPFPLDLRHTNLMGVELTVADKQRANLYRADLREADLRGAKLQAVDLREADLRGAQLGSDPERVFRTGASETAANLQEADLRGADLSRAWLIGVDLTRAKLADPGGGKSKQANLTHTVLCGADLTDAIVDEHDYLLDAYLGPENFPHCPQAKGLSDAALTRRRPMKNFSSPIDEGPTQSPNENGANQ